MHALSHIAFRRFAAMGPVCGQSVRTVPAVPAEDHGTAAASVIGKTAFAAVWRHIPIILAHFPLSVKFPRAVSRRIFAFVPRCSFPPHSLTPAAAQSLTLRA